MNPIAIVKKILSIGTDLEDGKKWQASHRIDHRETSKRPKVSRFTCGLQDGEVWFRYEFSEEDGPHDMRGTYGFKNKNEVITLDGNDVEADDVIISHRFQGTKLRAVVEFEFEIAEVLHRYRFDATLVGI